jgi:hypothetical protein
VVDDRFSKHDIDYVLDISTSPAILSYNSTALATEDVSIHMPGGFVHKVLSKNELFTANYIASDNGGFSAVGEPLITGAEFFNVPGSLTILYADASVPAVIYRLDREQHVYSDWSFTLDEALGVHAMASGDVKTITRTIVCVSKGSAEVMYSETLVTTGGGFNRLVGSMALTDDIDDHENTHAPENNLPDHIRPPRTGSQGAVYQANSTRHVGAVYISEDLSATPIKKTVYAGGGETRAALIVRLIEIVTVLAAGNHPVYDPILADLIADTLDGYILDITWPFFFTAILDIDHDPSRAFISRV